MTGGENAKAKMSAGEQIMQIRVAAGGYKDFCPICVRPASDPYRRTNVHRQITEGCVDACHESHLSPETASGAWHFRPEAEKIRAGELEMLVKYSKKWRQEMRRSIGPDRAGGRARGVRRVLG